MPLAPPLRAALLAGAAWLATPHDVSAQGGTWALTNARIETVTRGVIERGTIVIRDGLIAAAGATVTPPADARVADLAGRTVYPGLIDLTSTIGLPAPPAAAQRGPGGGPGAAQPGAGQGGGQAATVGLEPARRIADELRPAEADVRAARDAGITAVLVAPTRGAFRGLSALVPMRDDSATQLVVRSPVALHMGFEGVPGRYPQTLLGVIAYERQQLYDAQRHAQLADRYRQASTGMARPSYDPDLDALVPVVRRQLPVFFAAGNENEIRRALAIGREFNLDLTVVGATEAFRAIDALRGARTPVLAVDFPRPNLVTGSQYRFARRETFGDSARADSAVRRALEGNAAALHRAGIRFALASGGTRPADFLANVRRAVAAGLPRDVALQALTIRAAEAAGAGGQLGSIEPGKIANLVVAEGDVLADSARVRMVFVDGVRYEVTAPPAARGRAVAARGGRAGRAGEAEEAGQVTGTWALTINGPQGATSATLALTQTGDVLDGTMTGEFGTRELENGRVTGRAVSWSAVLPIGGQNATITFRGDVDGDRLTGTATLGERGTMTFTGERRP